MTGLLVITGLGSFIAAGLSWLADHFYGDDLPEDLCER